MKRFLFAVLILLTLPQVAGAFCGFYVARADGKLFNKASKVVFARHHSRSVITMSSDYRGAPKDFAMIVPTPKVLRRDQVRTVKPETVAHIDAYTAPRLVEYFDDDPCAPFLILDEPLMVEEMAGGGRKIQKRRGPAALGVTVKANYEVGIYDIAILEARQSDGLVTYLKQEGYKLPEGAEPVLGQYIKDGMKFFVARINLTRHKTDGVSELSPLQIRFTADRMMLPLQLGKLNGEEKQDLLIMTLTKTGRVEARNYRNARIPSDVNVPVFVKDMFGSFYRAAFAKAARYNTVMTEYAWDMAWCDPCAADPLSREELLELGVSWLKGDGNNPGEDVFVTRMHLQYGQNEFPDDLQFKVTQDRENFQGRYIMNVPFTGKMTCEAGKDYVRDMRRRLRREAVELEQLTNWDPRKIETRIRKTVPRSYW